MRLFLLIIVSCLGQKCIDIKNMYEHECCGTPDKVITESISLLSNVTSSCDDSNAPLTTVRESHSINSNNIPSYKNGVEYITLRPSGDVSNLPIVVMLHGGGNLLAERMMTETEQMFSRAWNSGLLPPLLAVSFSRSAGSSVLNFRSGDESWESFLLSDLLPRLHATQPVVSNRTILLGISNGGLGALRIAFRYPEKFVGVVAWEPQISACLTYNDCVLNRDLAHGKPLEMHDTAGMLQKYGNGGVVDTDYYTRNNPVWILRENSSHIVNHGIAIYIEVGSEDNLYLHLGAEFLHKQMLESGVPHEFRRVLGGNHNGLSLVSRFMNQLDFIARALGRTPLYGVDVRKDMPNIYNPSSPIAGVAYPSNYPYSFPRAFG